MRRQKLSSLVTIGLILLLPLSFADAQVPQLSPIPEGLSVSQREELMRLKSALGDKWTSLRSKVARHNQRCQKVPANTQRASECRQAMARLQQEIATYIESVNKFNLKVKQELKTADRTPFLSEKQEVELGKELSRLIESRMTVVTDPQVRSYMKKLLDQLANRSTRPKLLYTVKVVKKGQLNAFALPGGYIYVHSGLVRAASNESELAGVVAHEVAHIAARHHAKDVEKIAKSIGVSIVAGGFTGPATGFGLLTQRMFQEAAYMKFTRDEEQEADRLAVEMLYQAGIKPTGLITFFEKLRRQRPKKAPLWETFFSTHPHPEERMKNLEPLLADPRFNKIQHIDSANFQKIRAILGSP